MELLLFLCSAALPGTGSLAIIFQLASHPKSSMSAYSFSAEVGITQIRGNTLALLLFVIELSKYRLQSTSNEH
jgi:hypothetical protein